MKKQTKPLDHFPVERLICQYNKWRRYELSTKPEETDEKNETNAMKKTIIAKIKTNTGYKKVFLATEFGSELNKFCLEKFDINDVLKNIFGSVFYINTTNGLKPMNLN